MNLKVVIEQLSKLVDPGQSVIEITNIATLNDGDDFLLAKTAITLSIVNIEEDKTLRNQSVYLKETNDQTQISRYKQPTQHLIISVLFASYSKDLSKYLDGLDKLKGVISYFQQNNSFFYKNDDTEMIDYNTYLGKTEVQQQDYHKITMESVSLSTEQLNQLWSYLGSKYMPSMLYKMRLCMIQDSPLVQDNVIKKVKIDLWENDQKNLIGHIESGEFDA
ncbi:MAG TPA: Pvc16 family protein [Flavobacterium sp.]|nr:Pvc16 family protein [Flavobacterium sp.]